MGHCGVTGGGMVDFHRVSRLLFVFLLGVATVSLPTLCYAETIPATPTTVPADASGCPSATSTVRDPVTCAKVGGSGSYGAYEWKWEYSSGQCRSRGITYPNIVVACSAGAPVTTIYSCPDSTWELSGTSCIRVDCPDGEVRQSDGSCKNSCASIAGETLGTSSSVIGGSGRSGGNTACVAGCTVTSNHCLNAQNKNTGKWSFECLGPFVATGDSCTEIPAEEIPPDTPEYDCAIQGKASGTVNGQVICVTPDETTTKKKTTEQPPVVTPSPGTPTDPDNPTPTDPTNPGGPGGGGGPKTTEKTTTCTGTKCTTTTETTEPDGTKRLDVKEEDKSTFCEENPKSPMCKEGSFSGTCGSEPKCEGDAVQCAAAKAAWKLQCDLEKEPDDDAYKLGKSLLSGGKDTVENPLDPSKVVQTNVTDIIADAAGRRTLSGSCIQSPSFSVMGQTYKLDTSLFCEFAEIIGYLMVAASSVIAVRMVTSGAD